MNEILVASSPTGSGNSGSTFVEVPDVGLADYSVLVTDKNIV